MGQLTDQGVPGGRPQGINLSCPGEENLNPSIAFMLTIDNQCIHPHTPIYTCEKELGVYSAAVGKGQAIPRTGTIR